MKKHLAFADLESGVELAERTTFKGLPVHEMNRRELLAVIGQTAQWMQSEEVQAVLSKQSTLQPLWLHKKPVL